MTTSIDIRRATPDDIPAIVALWLELAGHHAAIRPEFALVPGAGSAHAEYLAKGMGSGERVVFLALDGGAPVGFVSIRALPPAPVFVPRRVAELSDLGVTLGHRRRGIGRTLWEHALAWAAAERFESIEIGVVAGNDGARRFWTALGFAPRFERMAREV